jgi:hypothetical protein
MSSQWTIAAATIFLFSAGVTTQAAGAQSEPKQKGMEKSEPMRSGANNENRQIGTAADRLDRVEHPVRTEENPGQSETKIPPYSLPSDPIRN